jgi:hypothetical protein
MPPLLFARVFSKTSLRLKTSLCLQDLITKVYALDVLRRTLLPISLE